MPLVLEGVGNLKKESWSSFRSLGVVVRVFKDFPGAPEEALRVPKVQEVLGASQEGFKEFQETSRG